MSTKPEQKSKSELRAVLQLLMLAAGLYIAGWLFFEDHELWQYAPIGFAAGVLIMYGVGGNSGDDNDNS